MWYACQNVTWYITLWVFGKCLFKAQPQGLLLGVWAARHKNSSSRQGQAKQKNTKKVLFNRSTKKCSSTKIWFGSKVWHQRKRSILKLWVNLRQRITPSLRSHPVVRHRVKHTDTWHPNVVMGCRRFSWPRSEHPVSSLSPRLFYVS